MHPETRKTVRTAGNPDFEGHSRLNLMARVNFQYMVSYY